MDFDGAVVRITGRCTTPSERASPSDRPTIGRFRPFTCEESVVRPVLLGTCAPALARCHRRSERRTTGRTLTDADALTCCVARGMMEEAAGAVGIRFRRVLDHLHRHRGRQDAFCCYYAYARFGNGVNASIPFQTLSIFVPKHSILWPSYHVEDLPRVPRDRSYCI